MICQGRGIKIIFESILKVKGQNFLYLVLSVREPLVQSKLTILLCLQEFNNIDQGCQTHITGDHISLAVAFKGPSVISAP